LAFFVGLLLIPVGALFGTLVVALLTLFSAGGPPPPGAFAVLLRIGLGFGAVFATPVCALVLPISYAVLRRRGVLTVRQLALIGGVAGILPIWAFALVEARRTGDLHVADGGVWALSAVAAIAGLAVGAAFAYVMRGLRPGDWARVPLGTSA
jgi:hypothetical protein